MPITRLEDDLQTMLRLSKNAIWVINRAMAHLENDVMLIFILSGVLLKNDEIFKCCETPNATRPIWTVKKARYNCYDI